MTSTGPLPRFDRTQQANLLRPLGVKLVASFQFFKAAILLGVALLLRLSPEVVTRSEGFLYPLFYIAMRGNTAAMEAAMQGGTLLPGIIGCLGLYMGFVGMGLLRMREWARRSLLLTCGITVALYVKSALLPDTTGAVGFASQAPNMSHFHVLLLLDAIMFAYFLRSHTAESFRVRANEFGVGRLQRLS